MDVIVSTEDPDAIATRVVAKITLVTVTVITDGPAVKTTRSTRSAFTELFELLLIALVDGTLTEITRAPHSFPRDHKHPRARRARIPGKFPPMP
jgi:hypothetical protein